MGNAWLFPTINHQPLTINHFGGFEGQAFGESGELVFHLFFFLEAFIQQRQVLLLGQELGVGMQGGVAGGFERLDFHSGGHERGFAKLLVRGGVFEQFFRGWRANRPWLWTFWRARRRAGP